MPKSNKRLGDWQFCFIQIKPHPDASGFSGTEWSVRSFGRSDKRRLMYDQMLGRPAISADCSTSRPGLSQKNKKITNQTTRTQRRLCAHAKVNALYNVGVFVGVFSSDSFGTLFRSSQEDQVGWVAPLTASHHVWGYKGKSFHAFCIPRI